jgi:hypothetical protein
MKIPVKRGVNVVMACLCMMAVLAGWLIPAAAQDSAKPEPLKIAIGLLRLTGADIVPLSRIDVPPADNGLAGAQLGIKDNQTTGRFTNQDFTLQTETASSDEQAIAILAKMNAAGVRFVVVDAPAATLMKLADAPAAKDMLLFNVSATDDGLRAKTASPTCFTSPPAAPCWPTRSRNISPGRNGPAGCLSAV